MLPLDIPGGAAAAARDTLGGAIVAAQTLPPEMAATFLSQAREAFPHSLQVVAGINVVIVLVMAVVALSVLRKRPA